MEREKPEVYVTVRQGLCVMRLKSLHGQRDVHFSVNF